MLDDYQLIHMKLIINKAINLLEFQPNLIQINLYFKILIYFRAIQLSKLFQILIIRIKMKVLII